MDGHSQSIDHWRTTIVVHCACILGIFLAELLEHVDMYFRFFHCQVSLFFCNPQASRRIERGREGCCLRRTSRHQKSLPAYVMHCAYVFNLKFVLDYEFGLFDLAPC